MVENKKDNNLSAETTAALEALVEQERARGVRVGG